MLVGNKSDLRHLRAVSTDEAMAFARPLHTLARAHTDTHASATRRPLGESANQTNSHTPTQHSLPITPDENRTPDATARAKRAPTVPPARSRSTTPSLIRC